MAARRDRQGGSVPEVEQADPDDDPNFNTSRTRSIVERRSLSDRGVVASTLAARPTADATTSELTPLSRGARGWARPDHQRRRGGGQHGNRRIGEVIEHRARRLGHASSTPRKRDAVLRENGSSSRSARALTSTARSRTRTRCATGADVRRRGWRSHHETEGRRGCDEPPESSRCSSLRSDHPRRPGDNDRATRRRSYGLGRG